jgi:hypothetical protein
MVGHDLSLSVVSLWIKPILTKYVFLDINNFELKNLYDWEIKPKVVSKSFYLEWAMLECCVTKLQVPSGFVSSCSKVVNQVFKSSLSVLMDNMRKLTSCTNCVVDNQVFWIIFVSLDGQYEKVHFFIHKL